MSYNNVDPITGELKRIAGRGTVEYGASTVRTGTITVTFTQPEDSQTIAATFDTPMPDSDYILIVHPTNASNSTAFCASSKTKTGFAGLARITNNDPSLPKDITYVYTAFKLHSVEGLEELENSVSNLESLNTRTQASCTSVKIKNTAVYARKRNGVVTINGATQLSADLTRNSWVEILTIPTGYRPANYEYGTAIIDTGVSGGIACPVDINASGSMRVFTYALSIPEDVDLTSKYIFISATYTTAN